jgi:hypothetical protein
MNNRISGEFEVKLTPQPLAEAGMESGLGRMSIAKQFRGELEGRSVGEMLSAMTSVQGSAGYVAIERVTGTLAGHSGSFVLQHHATMNRGVPRLSITVVADSGTGELTGLTGTMNIRIEGGKHFYDFEYSLGSEAASA